jgi:hypothetical protein
MGREYGAHPSAFKVLVGKYEKKRSLGRITGEWEGTIKMDLKEIILDVVNRTHFNQNRDQWYALENMVTKFWLPQYGANFLSR